MSSTKTAASVVAVMAVVALTACGSIPADPDGTLERVRATDVLRVGVSPAEPLVVISGAEPQGSLVDAMRDYASELDVGIQWSVDSEERLVAVLERGDLDVVIGGMTDGSPWSSRVALTRGFPGLAPNQVDPVALMVPMGENALLTSLEEHLDEQTQ